jgi:hypothetical protein
MSWSFVSGDSTGDYSHFSHGFCLEAKKLSLSFDKALCSSAIFEEYAGAVNVGPSVVAELFQPAVVKSSVMSKSIVAL